MSISSQNTTTDWSAWRVITEYLRANNPGIRSGGSAFEPSKLISSARLFRTWVPVTNIYVAAGDAFAAIVHLLEATDRFKVVSRPTVFTSNNKKAIIASGQEVPVPTSTLTNAGSH